MLVYVTHVSAVPTINYTHALQCLTHLETSYIDTQAHRDPNTHAFVHSISHTHTFYTPSSMQGSHYNHSSDSLLLQLIHNQWRGIQEAGLCFCKRMSVHACMCTGVCEKVRECIIRISFVTPFSRMQVTQHSTTA